MYVRVYIHAYVYKSVVTGLPCVCLSVMIGTDRQPSCLPFRHLPAHACCWQETALDEFLRAVSVRQSEDYGDVEIARTCLEVALLPGRLLAATGRATCHARCARTAGLRLERAKSRRCVLR
jgi:hypothetical protein